MPPNDLAPSQWKAPDKFQPVASAVEGITVYAPSPEKAQADGPTAYQCPQCGAATHYDVSAGGVACEHCGYTAATRAKQVGALAQTFEFTLETSEGCRSGLGR